MKRMVALCVALAGIAAGGCNYDVIDLKYSFDTAHISMPDGTAKTVRVRSWRDYENGDAVQIVDADGTVYLTHYCNVVLVKGERGRAP